MLLDCDSHLPSATHLGTSLHSSSHTFLSPISLVPLGRSGEKENVNKRLIPCATETAQNITGGREIRHHETDPKASCVGRCRNGRVVEAFRDCRLNWISASFSTIRDICPLTYLLVFVAPSFLGARRRVSIRQDGHQLSAFPGLQPSVWKFDARARSYIEQRTDLGCRAISPQSSSTDAVGSRSQGKDILASCPAGLRYYHSGGVFAASRQSRRWPQHERRQWDSSSDRTAAFETTVDSRNGYTGGPSSNAASASCSKRFLYAAEYSSL